MAYCTKADLVERFGLVELKQLTDEVAGTTEDDAEITKACDEATSLIDSYVYGRYSTPLSPVPTIVRKWACDIARKFLWKDRAQHDSVVQQSYDAAIAMLRDVARGTAQLPGATGTLPISSGSSVAVVATPQVFTDDQLGLMPGAVGGSFWPQMTP